MKAKKFYVSVALVGFAVTLVAGCATNGQTFNEKVITVDADTGFPVTTYTKIKSAQAVTLGAKQEQGVANVAYGAKSDGSFQLNTGTSAIGQQGDSLSETLKLLTPLMQMFNSGSGSGTSNSNDSAEAGATMEALLFQMGMVLDRIADLENAATAPQR